MIVPLLRPVLLALIAIVVAGSLGGDRAVLPVLQVVAVLGLLAALAKLPAPPPRSRRPGPPTDGRARFPSYDRAYAALADSRRSARLVDLQLRPVLDHIVAGPLEERGTDVVRTTLGEQVWEVVDPDRPSRSDSRGGGLDQEQLEHLVDRMEAL